MLLSLRTKVDDCLCASDLCRVIILFGVDRRLGNFRSTLYEASSSDVMSLRGDNDHDVDSAMDAVHWQLFALRGSVDAMHVQTPLHSGVDLLESDSGADDPPGSS